MSTAIPLPSSTRARAAYQSLRAVVPPELAARAVLDLERATDTETRLDVLRALPELELALLPLCPSATEVRREHLYWLGLHAYADVCAECLQELPKRTRIAIDPHSLRTYHVACQPQQERSCH